MQGWHAMNIATSPASIAGISETGWQIRCDLAALYRLVAHHRWTDFIYTPPSARLPGPDLLKCRPGRKCRRGGCPEQPPCQCCRLHHPFRGPHGAYGPDVRGAYAY